MRNEPPISTSSPRETMTSPPSASAFSASSTAAALLLTTMVETSRSPVVQQLRKQATDMDVALAALAGGQIELQIRVALRDLGNMLQRRLRERRAPEVGMQDDARGVDDRTQRVAPANRSIAAQSRRRACSIAAADSASSSEPAAICLPQSIERNARDASSVAACPKRCATRCTASSRNSSSIDGSRRKRSGLVGHGWISVQSCDSGMSY